MIFFYSYYIFSFQLHNRYQLPPGTAAEQAEKRLLYIPALFLLLRIWGTAQFFYSIGVSSDSQEPGCIPHGIQIGFMIFGILQVSNNTYYIAMQVCTVKREFSFIWVHVITWVNVLHVWTVNSMNRLVKNTFPWVTFSSKPSIFSSTSQASSLGFVMHAQDLTNYKWVKAWFVWRGDSRHVFWIRKQSV